jgi:hypothetical protein
MEDLLLAPHRGRRLRLRDGSTMRSLCPESYIGEKENEPAQALPSERASVVRCHGHSSTAPADETWKSFPIGDQRPVLQGYQDGPPANSYRIVGRPSILRPLGLRVRTAGLPPDRQRTAVHCYVFPSCMQRVGNPEDLYDGLSSPDKWAGRTI